MPDPAELATIPFFFEVPQQRIRDFIGSKPTHNNSSRTFRGLCQNRGMKNLFEPERVDEIRARIARIRPDSPQQWGEMDAAQALAHCSEGLSWAVGDTVPPRMFFGSLLGRAIKGKVLGDDAPMRRNSPTAKTLIVADARELAAERERFLTLLDRFASGGPTGCTVQAHSFFGRLTPMQWAILMYKHIDHHLRQFGV